MLPEHRQRRWRRASFWMAALLLLLVVTLDYGQCAPKPRGYSRKLRAHRPVAWMASIPDDTPLTAVTLPGTHDSGSYKYKDLVSHQCQTMTIKEQLLAGIRFLDLRVVSLTKGGTTFRLAHGFVTTATFAPKLTDVMDDIVAFLRDNPTEVIVAFLRREDGYWIFPGSLLREALDPYQEYIANYYGANFTYLGHLRGMIAFKTRYLSDVFDPMNANVALNSADEQDNYTLDTQQQSYEKWKDITKFFYLAASSPRGGEGHINFLSANGNVLMAAFIPPYFVASGRSSPTGPSAWTGVSAGCLDARSKMYPDYPRKDCVLCGGATVCSIHYGGMNNLAYDYIAAAMRGEAATHEERTITYPSQLGAVLMDFPSNDLIDALISVNFQKQAHLSQDLPPLTAACTRKGCSCVAGDARVETAARGVVAARDVGVGDALRGPGAGEWCRVLAVAATGRGVVHGDFTADHLVVGAPSSAGGAGRAPAATAAVAASGAGGGPAREVDRVNIATECPAARLASGALFTPLSTVFCARRLDWGSYTALYAAIVRVVRRTGAFWFDPSIYVDAGGAVPGRCAGAGAGDDGGASWAGGLPPLCDAMTACAVAGERCAALEVAAARWIDAHVPAELRAKVRRAYPRLGDAAATSGNLLSDVRPRAQRWPRLTATLIPTTPIPVAAAATALLTVCCSLVAAALRQRTRSAGRRRVATTPLPPSSCRLLHRGACC